MNSPSEADIIRFIIDLAEVRDDEDEVKAVIDRKLADTHDYLHAALLRVTLRVLVAQFYAPPIRRLEHELGYPITEIALMAERRALDGPIDDEDADEDDARPHLRLIPS